MDRTSFILPSPFNSLLSHMILNLLNRTEMLFSNLIKMRVVGDVLILIRSYILLHHFLGLFHSKVCGGGGGGGGVGGGPEGFLNYFIPLDYI